MKSFHLYKQQQQVDHNCQYLGKNLNQTNGDNKLYSMTSLTLAFQIPENMNSQCCCYFETS